LLLNREDDLDEIAETPTGEHAGEKPSGHIFEGIGRTSPFSSMERRGRSTTLGRRRESALRPPNLVQKRGVESNVVVAGKSPIVYGTPHSIANRNSKRSRPSLAKAVSLRHVNADGLKDFDTPRTKTPLSVRDLAESSPGIFIPSIPELDVTGSELADDMAGNLVAGIFSVSESEAQWNMSDSLQGKPLLDDSPETIENELESNALQCLEIDETSPSILLRLPDCCLYARASHSGKYIAMLLGGPIDRDPREIVILSLGYLDVEENESKFGLNFVRSILVQKSKQYFPRSIPYNVNFFTVHETKRGDPILLVSAALDVLDIETQGDQPVLHVIPCGKTAKLSHAVSVETERPIIFVESHRDSSEYSIVISGAFAEDGARVMTFDPMWQSFAWGREFCTSSNSLSSAVTTHISKLVSINGSLKAVLASDCSSSDMVYNWEDEGRGPHLVSIENAELFVDGHSWEWFVTHQESIQELSFAGRESQEKRDARSLTVIFASEQYVAMGDVHGSVQVWDVKKMLSKRFTIQDPHAANDRRISSIVQTTFGNVGPALCITSISGTCMLMSCTQLFSDDENTHDV